jgi:glycosyltransferase involved in cell wall biosynthesis
VLRRLDGLIGVNPEIVRLYQRFGVPDDRIRMIEPHAVSAPPANVELPGILRTFFQAHQPVLLSVGGLEPEYDVPIQIEVLERVRRQLPRAGLAILGTGSLEQDLRDQIAARPYAEHVLLAGDVQHVAALRAIEECGMMLRTTLYDGDSISVREALHLGTPVIATDNGLRPDGVSLIPVGDLEKLEAAILRTAAGPRGRPQAGSNDTNIRAVIDFYEELLALRCRGASGNAGRQTA